MPEQFPDIGLPALPEFSPARPPGDRRKAATPSTPPLRADTPAVDGSISGLPQSDDVGSACSAVDISLESAHRGNRWVPAILRDRRVLVAALALVVLAVAAAVVPRPSITSVRDWAESMGALFVLVFFLAQVVLTIAPVPRTVFTLGAGLLFGPAVGIAVTIAATTVSAVLAFLLVRVVGRSAVKAHLTHPAVKAIDARLARRGWLAVGSLRLIAPAPFALVNYCSGLSAVRLLPYTAATVVGILPGTISAVLFGDALTGQTHPALIVVTTVCVAVGIAGLLTDARLPIPAVNSIPRTMHRSSIAFAIRGRRAPNEAWQGSYNCRVLTAAGFLLFGGSVTAEANRETQLLTYARYRAHAFPPQSQSQSPHHHPDRYDSDHRLHGCP